MIQLILEIYGTKLVYTIQLFLDHIESIFFPKFFTKQINFKLNNT